MTIDEARRNEILGGVDLLPAGICFGYGLVISCGNDFSIPNCKGGVLDFAGIAHCSASLLTAGGANGMQFADGADDEVHLIFGCRISINSEPNFSSNSSAVFIGSRVRKSMSGREIITVRSSISPVAFSTADAMLRVRS